MLDNSVFAKAAPILRGLRQSRAALIALLTCLVMAASALATAILIAPAPLSAQQGGTPGEVGGRRAHMGVASCAGSTCHGRSIGDGRPGPVTARLSALFRELTGAEGTVVATTET